MSILLLALSAAGESFPGVLGGRASRGRARPAEGRQSRQRWDFTDGAQPLIVPSKVANRKTAGDPLILKSDDPLKTVPVGEPGPSSPFVGINTSRATLVPWLS